MLHFWPEVLHFYGKRGQGAAIRCGRQGEVGGGDEREAEDGMPLRQVQG